MDDGYNGNFNLAYNGAGFPYVLTYTATGLTTGLPYRFKVIALNINGASNASDFTTIYACLKPTNVLTPFKVSTTKNSITIGW